MEKVFKLLLGAALVLALFFGFVYSGLFNVSAMVPHSALTTWVLSTTMHASVRRRAGDVVVPALDDASLQLAGANDYAAMCAGCHGAPGLEPEPVGLGMTPPPPDLSESARHLSDAELFWVTRNGIRMTGMPAWGRTHAEEDLWPVIAFLRLLPSLDATSYREMLARAQGTGHHAAAAPDGHGHEHAAGSDAPREPAAPSADATGAAAPAGMPDHGGDDGHAGHMHAH